MDVDVFDSELRKIDHRTQSTSSSLNYSFTPEKSGKHLICISADGIAVAGWPFQLKVNEPLALSQLRVYGQGLGEDVTVGKATSFIIDSRQVGSNDVEVVVEDAKGNPLEAELSGDKSTGLRTVTYTPFHSGAHRVKVFVESDPIFDVETIVHDADAKRSFQRTSSLYLKHIKDGEKFISASVRTPKGAEEEAQVYSVGDQYRITFHPRHEGLHSVSVFSDGQHVEGSPFQLPFSFPDGYVPENRASATGSGLVGGQANTLETFSISAEQLDAGELSVTIDGPSKADVIINDEKDGICRVDYRVAEPGLYEIDIRFNDTHIDGSPFKVQSLMRDIK